jgi:hypothetical protein
MKPKGSAIKYSHKVSVIKWKPKRQAIWHWHGAGICSNIKHLFGLSFVIELNILETMEGRTSKLSLWFAKTIWFYQKRKKSRMISAI